VDGTPSKFVIPIEEALLTMVNLYAYQIGSTNCSAAVRLCSTAVNAACTGANSLEECYASIAAKDASALNKPMREVDERYMTYTDPKEGGYYDAKYAPAGIVKAEPFDSVMHEFRNFPVMPMNAYDAGVGAMSFGLADLKNGNICKYGGAGEVPTLTFFPNAFYLMNLKKTQDYMDVIDNTNIAIANSPLKDIAYVYSIPHTYWGVFLELRGHFWVAFGIDVGVIFFWTLVFLRSPTAAIACAVSACSIVMELYGVLTIFAQWNTFSAATLLMSMGVSIVRRSHYRHVRDAGWSRRGVEAGGNDDSGIPADPQGYLLHAPSGLWAGLQQGPTLCQVLLRVPGALVRDRHVQCALDFARPAIVHSAHQGHDHAPQGRFGEARLRGEASRDSR